MSRPLNYFTPPPTPPRRREAPAYVGVIALMFSTLGFPCCYAIGGGLTNSYTAATVLACVGQLIGIAAAMVSIRTAAGKLAIFIAIVTTLLTLTFLFG